MKKTIIVTAAILGLLAVVAGAFGAHSLQKVLSPAGLEIWHTAVQYQFYHVFALLFTATLTRYSTAMVKQCYYLFLFGMIFFCGSLYLLAFHDIKDFEWTSAVGPITPIGGLFFIAGWVMMAVTAYKKI
jgi:uncharacterized membrane protein YgdD (TMEM256/DUF423 family)